MKLLDQELADRDGSDHSFYAQFNKVDQIKHVVVGYFENQPVCIGAFKPYSNKTVEIKRMFVREEHRGKGFANHVLEELENWAHELHFNECILETGKKQPEAIRFYQKSGYQPIPNYDQYIGDDNSVCMSKTL